MSFLVALGLLSVVTAMTCAFPGIFLVLRRQSMLVDAMSHAVLPGIVIGAIMSGTTHSPIMIFMAALMGLVVVIGAEKLRDTGMLTADSSQGLIFPVLFAIGVAILSTSLSSVHICENTILAGELNLMALPSEHIHIGGFSIGPTSMWLLLGVLLLNVIYVAITYRVLKVSIFDPCLAETMGFPVKAVNLGLMMLVALTVVVAFDTAGAILVVVLMIVPPTTALLLTHRLSHMIGYSMVIAAITALVGLWAAYIWDLATSPMMAFTEGVIFLLVLAATKVWQKFAYRPVVA